MAEPNPEERFTQLDLRIREQHFELQQSLRGIADGIRALPDGQRVLTETVQSLSADIKALIARLDALIKGRGDGSPSPMSQLSTGEARLLLPASRPCPRPRQCLSARAPESPQRIK